MSSSIAHSGCNHGPLAPRHPFSPASHFPFCCPMLHEEEGGPTAARRGAADFSGGTVPVPLHLRLSSLVWGRSVGSRGGRLVLAQMRGGSRRIQVLPE